MAEAVGDGLAATDLEGIGLGLDEAAAFVPDVGVGFEPREKANVGGDGLSLEVEVIAGGDGG